MSWKKDSVQAFADFYHRPTTAPEPSETYVIENLSEAQALIHRILEDVHRGINLRIVPERLQ